LWMHAPCRLQTIEYPASRDLSSCPISAKAEFQHIQQGFAVGLREVGARLRARVARPRRSFAAPVFTIAAETQFESKKRSAGKGVSCYCSLQDGHGMCSNSSIQDGCIRSGHRLSLPPKNGTKRKETSYVEGAREQSQRDPLVYTGHE
jgi:hypothetical protein